MLSLLDVLWEARTGFVDRSIEPVGLMLSEAGRPDSVLFPRAMVANDLLEKTLKLSVFPKALEPDDLPDSNPPPALNLVVPRTAVAVPPLRTPVLIPPAGADPVAFIYAFCSQFPDLQPHLTPTHACRLDGNLTGTLQNSVRLFCSIGQRA